LEIVKLASTKKWTSKELAALYNVKVHAIYDLKSDVKRRPAYFLKKKETEVARSRQQTSIIKTVIDTL
jgi:hypothetical protein